MASASSSSRLGPNAPRKYDVFISFRGETRNNFTSHLHAALKRAFLEVFLDDRKLEKGEEIKTSLIRAINDSSLSVIVFSEDYASSKWCLDELAQIMKCRNKEGQFVIPIFYKVEPRDVRNQTGTYGKAFEKHGMHYPTERVNTWRAALSEAGKLSGTYCQASTDETKLINDIVSDVIRKLELVPHWRVTLKGVIGRKEMIEPIKELLEKYHKVGIWGMGGVGKTTMAKVVFATLSSQYGSRCFLDNVREKTERNGLEHVRNSLVSKLLGEDVQIDSSNEESFLGRLGRTKALVVLDDVDTTEQLISKNLLDNTCNFLGEGSKVIITTRDQKLLRGNGYEIYEAKGLSYANSRRLFIHKAFGSNNPEDGYEELIKGFVDYTKYNPLALEVLGLYVRSEDKKLWDGLLRKLRAGNPNGKIQKVLRLSYDKLGHTEQQIFLEIACLLKGESEEFVEELLESYELYPSVGIPKLIDRALVVKSSGKLNVHDLLQEMGHQIVREENIKQPGKRSRLWDSREILEVLKNCEGETEVEGIIMSGSCGIISPSDLTSKSFNKMTELRFLKAYSSGCSPTNLESISTKIRYFHWNGYLGKSLPSNFCAKHLLELNLEFSHVETLWKGVQDLSNLRRLKLLACAELREIPDFSKACRLESVDLSHCTSLCYVHESLLSLHSLISLDVSFCYELERLQSRIHLKSLKQFYIDGCFRLKEFSISSEELTSLDLSATVIEELSPSIVQCSKLRELRLYDTNLKNLPMKVLSCLTFLENLKVSGLKIDNEDLQKLFDQLRSLQLLSLWKCWNFTELDNITQLSSLERLHLNECSDLTKLPVNMSHLSKLQYLSIEGCTALQSLPELPSSLTELIATCCKSLDTVYLSTISSLERLHLEKCTNLTKLHDNIRHLSKLQYLSVEGCTALQSLPELPSSLTELIATCCKSLDTVYLSTISSLERLHLEKCTNLTKLHDNIRHLSKLQYLSVEGCTALQSLPELPPSLRELIATGCKSLKTASFSTALSLERLHLEKCPNLTKLQDNMRHLSMLQYLSVEGCTALQSLPELPSSLTELIATCCKLLDTVYFSTISSLESLHLENCTNLTKLPDNIRHLSKLQYLSVEGCTELQSLPELPHSLRKLIATNCTSLEAVSFSSISSTPKNYGEKVYSFINCEKLDLGAIEEQAKLLLEKAVHKKEDVTIYYPRKKVPEWFGNNGTQKDSNTLKLSLSSHTLVGFVFCVVIPPDLPLAFPDLIISFSVEEDEMTAEELRGFSYFLDIRDLNPGNVLLCSCPEESESILEEIESHRGNHEATTYNTNLFFTFSFEDRCDNQYPSKECGVYPIYASGYLELNSNSRKRKAVMI